MSAWYDVDAVKGAYLEGGLTVRVPVWTGMVVPIGSLFLGAVVGYSAGQEINATDPTETAHFAEDGVTHIDVSADLTVGYLEIGPLNGALNIEFHLQRNRDPATKVIDGAGNTGNVIPWFGVTLTVLGPRCRPTRAICRN
jgi:hypothetical protein